VKPWWPPFGSVRSRVLGWSVLLLAAALAASVVTMHVFLVRQLDARVNSELTHEIAEFQALEAQSGANIGSGTEDKPAKSVLVLLRARTSQAVLERDTVLLGLINGRIAAISGNSSQGGIGASRALLARWWAVSARAGNLGSGGGPPVGGAAQLGVGPARYLAVPAHAGSGATGVFVAIVLTGQSQAGVMATTRLQAEVGVVALLLGAALAWLAAGRVLRPVRDTTELARRITDTSIAGRIPVRGRGEISELAHTLNRMLDRLEAALTAQRRFLADAGHELRTPLTIIQGNLDTLVVADDEDISTLGIVSDELTRMTRLVDELTLLARTERPDFLRPVPADLAELTAALAAKARALDQACQRRFTLASVARGTAVLDPQRVTQAVMQLVVNAVAHTPPGTAVEIGSAITADHVEFRVADHGPGIPPHLRERVFDRFARLDGRRTDGTGLGLSIVAAIGAAHNGTVRIADRDPDGPGSGAVITLSIPLHRPATRPPQPPWAPRETATTSTGVP
jgi:signal transduction histidine kinase